MTIHYFRSAENHAQSMKHSPPNTTTNRMKPPSNFHRLWPPVLIVFQLFGFATYSSAARTCCQLCRRRLYSVLIIATLSALGIYALFTRITFHEMTGHVNVMSDQTVYLTILPAHLVALLEALLKHRRVARLFERVHAIALGLSGANGKPIVDFERLCGRQLLANWLQMVGVMVLLSTGVTLSG